MERWEQLARLFVAGYQCNEQERRNTFLALFDLCSELGRLEAEESAAGEVRFTTNQRPLFTVPAAKPSKFRNYLAELAALSSDGGSSVSPYGGNGTIRMLSAEGTCEQFSLQMNNSGNRKFFILKAEK